MQRPNPDSKPDPSVSSTDSDASDLLDLDKDEEWEDAEPEENDEHFISFVDEQSFTSLMAMLDHCRLEHNLDFMGIRDKYNLDFYDTVKLVNFIRSQRLAGREISSSISKSDFDDEKFLKPVLEDDAVLFGLDELPAAETIGLRADLSKDSVSSDVPQLLHRVAELEGELKKAQSQFLEYRNTVKQTLDDRWNEGSASPPKSSEATKRDDDTHYFSSYSYNDIHETMLKDTVRTDAYRDFVYQNKHLFANKVVLDVGCGTGILSMFCAKAGAAKVFAVDNSAIIDKARENIYLNGLADQITCLRGKVEEVALPVQHVDIIISEWMGYALLYEAMLDSVIWARDRYLKPEGLMVPSHMNMWLAPIADPEYVNDHVHFWRDIYGFDMKPMQAGIHEEGLVLHMPTKTICAEPFPFLQLSLHTTTVKDLSFRKSWKTTLSSDIDALDGFAIWFDTFFVPSRQDGVPPNARAEAWNSTGGSAVAFTTGPFSKETHWRQAIFLIDNPAGSHAGPLKSGGTLDGELEYAVPEDNSRALNVSITWSVEAGEKRRSQLWKMK